MRSLLLENAPLRLFMTVGLGYLLGQIRFRGVGLDVAGVLFAGILAGAWGGPQFALPEIVTVVGLSIFMYTLGLQAGPAFFGAFRSQGLRLTLLAAAALLAGVIIVAGGALILRIPAGTAVGLFCGGTTNTPALGAVLETLRGALPPDSPLLSAPTIGYGVAYPFGVLGLFLAMQAGVKLLRIRLPEELEEYEKQHGRGEILVRNVVVTKEKPGGGHFSAGWVMEQTGAVLTRHRRGSLTEIAGPDTVLLLRDVVMVVASPEAMGRAVALMGEETGEHLNLARPDISMRRILVSSPKVAGKRISDLHLEALGAVITRVRRGDVEVAGTPGTVLEIGDRVRVVAYEWSFDRVVRLLGDSIRTMAESDFLPLAFGLSIGVLVGMLPVPLPGGGALRLGAAGGPLIVALILGRFGKTGPFVWSLPMEVSFTLRQLGLILFLVTVGIRAGSDIAGPLREQGPELLGLGCAITLGVAAVTLALGRLALRLNAVELLGVLAGVHTQPAALAFAQKWTHSDGTSLAYAAVHPIATILKILAAQILLAWLPG